MENGNERLLRRVTGLLILEVVNSNPNGDRITRATRAYDWRLR